MAEPLGSLREVSSTEDRTLYAYRTRRRLVRGLAWMGIALLLVGAALLVGRPAGRWYAWIFAILPSVGGSAAAYCGMLDLLNRPRFQLEVDRRARSLSLVMPREQGHDLAKVRFSEITQVEVRQKGAPPTWTVTLLLRNGRRIGLGISDDPADSEETARRFAQLIGVEVVRGAPP